MRLREALRIQRGDIVAFVGAGGKTSALFQLADELRAEGWRVLATTTTRLAAYEIERAPLAMQVTADPNAALIRQQLDRHGFVFVYTAIDGERHKITGLSPELITGLVESVNGDVLLIEADGARRLPLKAPKDHEPVIPPATSLVVPVAGMDVLGQPLNEDHVYNASRILARYGISKDALVIPPWIAFTIRDPQLGLRGVPDHARVIPLLNKVGTGRSDLRRARRTAQMILRSDRIEAVALGAVQERENPVYELQRRVAAVVLAAGVASGIEPSKTIEGRTVIEAMVTRLLAAHLAEIVVVTGHQADEVARTLARLPVRIVFDPNYTAGATLSSLRTGLRALPDTIAACLVVPDLLDRHALRALLAAYAQGKGEIVYPTYRGEGGYPVLIGQRFWPELLSGAPHDIIRRHPDHAVAVDTGRDSDTPER